MDLRQVETFVTVAELGTVTKAALRLHVAQPALSRQIIALEQSLGVRLFDRVGRRMILSGSGEELLNDCRALLNYSRALMARAQSLSNGDVGTLTIGASPQHIESVLSQFIHRFAKEFPRVQVNIIEGSGSEILEMLERATVDVGMNLIHSRQIDEQRFASQPLGWVELLGASRTGWGIGQRGMVRIEQLAEHPLLLLDSGFGFRRAFDAACRVAGVKPQIRFESHSPHTLLAMAEAGHGIAVIPSALRTDRYALSIVAITYRGRVLREPLTVMWDRRRPLARYAVAFREMWVAHVDKVFPITSPTQEEKL
jgi:DNA-binding transcriptional LysR family regulator